MNQEFRESMVGNLKVSPRENEASRQMMAGAEHNQSGLMGMSPKAQRSVKFSKNKKTIYFLFFVVLTMNLLINFDHGVMPAGSVQLKEDLGLNNAEYGWLGSVVFIGLTLGKYLPSTSPPQTTRCLRLNSYNSSLHRLHLRILHVPEVQLKVLTPLHPPRERLLPLHLHSHKNLRHSSHQSLPHRLLPSLRQHLLSSVGRLFRYQ